MSISTSVRTAVGACALAAGIGIVGAPDAAAQTGDSENLGLSARVISSCVINSTTAIDFGDYLVGGPEVARNGALEVQCTRGSQATIALDKGVRNNRTMIGPGGDTLQYELYKSDGTTVWDSSSTVSYTAADALPKQFTVTGKIAGGQDKAAGSYSDTVLATINLF